MHQPCACLWHVILVGRQAGDDADFSGMSTRRSSVGGQTRRSAHAGLPTVRAASEQRYAYAHSNNRHCQAQPIAILLCYCCLPFGHEAQRGGTWLVQAAVALSPIHLAVDCAAGPCPILPNCMHTMPYGIPFLSSALLNQSCQPTIACTADYSLVGYVC